MKDSKEYSKKVQTLYRSLKRKYPKFKKVSYDNPEDAVVYGIVGEYLSSSATQLAIKSFGKQFCDWNDLRVARPEEIVEALGSDSEVNREVASTLIRALRSIFLKYNTVSLGVLGKLSKRPARQVLEKLDSVNRFVVDYVCLTALHSHAIPLTAGMIEYLKANEFVYPEADQDQIAGFLCKQISAKNGYEFYCLLRKVSESSKPKKKRTAAGKKMVKKKKKAKKTTKKSKSKKKG